MSKELELLIADNIDKYTNNGCKIIRNEESPYVLFNAKDIGKIIGLKNIRMQIKTSILITILTSGGNQKVAYITYQTLLKLLTKSRKRTIYEFANLIGIDIKSTSFACIEADTINCIITTFKGEETIEQYIIDSYIVDLYFPKYKLAVECDEKQHNLSKNISKDIERENKIKEILDCTFIRYKPYDKDFNMFELLNKIFIYIKIT